MQLTQIKQIQGTLVLHTGLHIGGGDTEMHIGGVDNQVVKNPVDGLPYIPGSSLKGKIRSLLEWKLGLITVDNEGPYSFKQIKENQLNTEAANLLRLFGGAPYKGHETKINVIGPTRLAFWDCSLNPTWKEEVLDKRNLSVFEAKSENTIDRISGTAGNPRFTERVIAGAQFNFRLSLKVQDNENLLPLVLKGLKLLELDSLGGSGSRGYGKVKFENLEIDNQKIQNEFDAINPFEPVM
jgi:CRISPR-associated protein Csm3